MIISPIKFNNNNYYNSSQNITFNSRRQIFKIKKASLKNPECKKVYEKASFLVNKLPKGDMKIPYIYKTEKNSYGIHWNTSDENNLILEIRDKVNTISEWEKPIEDQTVLDCTFNKNGIMKDGTITKRIKNNYSLNAHYERKENNKKTLVIDGITYRPYPGSDEYWSSIPSLSCYNIKKDINLFDFLGEIGLSEIFCSLTQKNTSIK